MLFSHLSLSFLRGIFFSICNQYSAWISHKIHAYYMFHFSASLIWLPKQYVMHIINYKAPPHTIFSNLLSHSPLSILLCNHIHALLHTRNKQWPMSSNIHNLQQLHVRTEGRKSQFEAELIRTTFLLLRPTVPVNYVVNVTLR